MSIIDIYQKYKIIPNLAEHQLRVAGVAEVICGHISPTVNTRDVVTACLLHDMGNIIKFNLEVTQKMMPGKFTDEQINYWKQVKAGFVGKYGNDEHAASVAIAEEVGVGERVIELIESIGFNTGLINAVSNDYERKICAYSDMRVGPFGVIPLEERLADLRERYDHKVHQVGGSEQKRIDFENSLRMIEQQIFERCDIKPEEITAQAVTEKIKGLRGLEI
jgi:hypothetical protein